MFFSIADLEIPFNLVPYYLCIAWTSKVPDRFSRPSKPKRARVITVITFGSNAWANINPTGFISIPGLGRVRPLVQIRKGSHREGQFNGH